MRHRVTAGEVRFRPLFFALFLVSLLGALNLTIVAASLATIAGDLGGVEHMVWAISSFALGSTIALPIYGQLADIRGHRRMFLQALVVFLVGSVLCGLSMSMLQLTLARFVQGVGGAGIGVLAQTILAEAVPPRQRARYMAVLGSVFAVATVTGPVIGGLLTDTVGWRWIFFFSVPFGVVAFAVAIRAIPRRPAPRPSASFDLAGAALLAVALAAIVVALSLGGDSIAWRSPGMLALGAVAIGGLGGFVAVERRATLPLVPFVMFRDRVVVSATALLVVVGIGILSIVAFLPAFVQMRFAVPAAVAGAVDIAIVAGLLAATNVTGVLVSRTGRYRWYPIVGNALAAVALAVLALVAGTAPLPVLVVLFCLVGAGGGAYMQIALVLVQNQAPREYLGVATSSANLIRQMGITISGSIIGTLFGASVVRHLGEIELPGGIDPADLTPQLVRASSGQFKAQVADAYTSAMTPIFWALAAAFAVGLVIAIYLPTVEFAESHPSEQPGPAATLG
jgi:EmrB/QacA subfamily drug resistance transporter